MHDARRSTHDARRSRAGLAAGLLLTATLVLVGQFVAAGTALGVAAPASGDDPPAGTDRPSEAEPGDAGVQLGPATKFVREADGSVRQLR